VRMAAPRVSRPTVRERPVAQPVSSEVEERRLSHEALWRRFDAMELRLTAAVSERMLELASLGSGMRVLDLATGRGEPAIRAAHCVGETGHVLGIDLSEGLSPTVAPELQDVAAFVAESLAPSTRRAYRSALANFREWCAVEGLGELPAAPETVARYVAAGARAGKNVSTLQQRLAAIKWAHEAHNHDSPTATQGVRSTMAGIRRQLGTAPKRKSPGRVECGLRRRIA
jgi:hypothetical protein